MATKGRETLTRKITKHYNKAVRKLLHRKGHGVHSPFVFNFIIRVIEEKARYYAYDKIEEEYKKSRQQARVESKQKPLPLKYYKLLYRVANRVKPRTILECGNDNGVVTQTLALATKNKNVATIKTNYEFSLKNYFAETAPDFIYIHAQPLVEDCKTIYTLLTPQVKEEQVIVISGIRTTKQIYNLFKEFAMNTRIKVTIDLYDMAILVASTKLNKQTFKQGF